MSPTYVLRNIFTVVFTILLSAAIFTGCGKKTEEKKDEDEAETETETGNTKEKWVQILEKNVEVFRSAKAEKAASYIADRFPGGTVAFLIDEASYNDSESESRLVLDEMRKRLTEKGVNCDETLTVNVVAEEDDANAKKRSNSDREAVFAKDMNNALREVIDKVDIVVNFAGMPKSASAIKSINLLRKASSSGKNNMLLMSDAGLAFVSPDTIRLGRFCAIIDYVCSDGPGVGFDITRDAAPNAPAKAFDYLYYLLDDETLDRFLEDGNKDFFLK